MTFIFIFSPVVLCYYVKISWCISVSDMSTPGSLEVVVVDGTSPKFLSTVITPNATPGTCNFRGVHYHS